MRERISPRLLALLLGLSGFSPVGAAGHRMVGTDLLGVEFSKALYEFTGRHRLEVALAFDGSRPGLDELKAGRADLALLVLPAGEESAVPVFQSIPVAYHRVVVIVPVACPMAHVTFDQLAGIFGVSPGRVERWRELGIGGEWADSLITALAPEVGVGIAVEYFRHLVLAGREFKPNVIRYTDAAGLAARFSGEMRGVALAAVMPAAVPELKVLPVAVRARGPAFLPTPENLHSGDYVLGLPLRLVVRREALPALLPLVRFLGGDEGAPHFERAGVVPLPALRRTQQLLAFEKGESCCAGK